MNDQFPQNSDSDATVMVMAPGRRTLAAASGQSFVRPGATATEASMSELLLVGGLNPTVSAAYLLLSAVPRIRTTVAHPNPNDLRETLLQQIGQFEAAARSRGVSPESVLVARYALCTLIDETVAGTPWGGTADWIKQSLLVTLHRETWGGEKFFQLLNKMAEDPTRNIDLLELFYACLALGFEGRFRVVDGGKAQLETLRERLADIIRRTRGEYERDLSGNWHGEQTNLRQANSFVTLWASAAVAALLLLGLFVWMSFSLNGVSDALAFGQVQAPKPVRVVAAQPAPPRLKKFLEAEIAAGLVEVFDEAAESRVIIRGDGLFDSGSTTVKANYEHTIARIAEAINGVQGTVLITGHTDNQPIRSLRFPSNWHLSQERANSVMQMMATVVKEPSRMKAEGRADQEPRAANDTPDNRARNRRVEVIVRVAAA
ncbi:MAG: DotU family type VI secretion system protein [Rhodocyclaceae bacterium]|nr:DotU family type VI secretion system protein [Rhodocyclaceae bacterium]